MFEVCSGRSQGCEWEECAYVHTVREWSALATRECKGEVVMLPVRLFERTVVRLGGVVGVGHRVW